MLAASDPIITSLREWKHFHEEISSMLRSCQNLGYGWCSSVKGNSCIIEHSDLLTVPSRWIPSVIYQLYRNNDCPGVVTFLTVILDYQYDLPEIVFSHPMIACGYYVYDSSKDGYLRLWPRNLCFCLYIRNESNMDAFIEKDVSFFARHHKLLPIEGMKKARSLACPLNEIESSEEIKRRLIDPLLDDIHEKVPISLGYRQKLEAGD